MVKNSANHVQNYPADADIRLSKVGCMIPFRTIEIHHHGQISLCCYTWLPEFCGNILTDSAQQILENFKRQEILQGMRQGRFDHCTDHCPRISQFLTEGSNPDIVPLEELDHRLSTAFYHVYFTYDDSCNLECPSCRKHLTVHKLNDHTNPTAVRLAQIHHKVTQLVQLLLDQGHTVQLDITGSGDPFASPIYWNYLKELAAAPIHPNLRIGLQTNGVMMTERRWQDIRPLWPHIHNINVSVDAATADTYKIVRKGGNFEVLVANLDHLDAMIARGDLPILSTWVNNFIVQRDNFRELQQFMEWQLTYKSMTTAWTNLIAQWSHLADDEYRDMAIWQQGHAQRSELIEILKDPIFDNPRIYLGNMSTLRSQALAYSA
jgi:pyruvate-formate lyase-activating enzyme